MLISFFDMSTAIYVASNRYRIYFQMHKHIFLVQYTKKIMKLVS